MSIGSYSPDMVGSHRHVKANGYANPAGQYNDADRWAQVGDFAVGGAIYTGSYGGPETKPASISVYVCLAY
jgi:hypothetical protein